MKSNHEFQKMRLVKEWNKKEEMKRKEGKKLLIHISNFFSIAVCCDENK